MDKEYYAHPTAIIDEGSKIAKGVKIWHFTHIMPDCVIGEGCNIGQNVVISPQVVVGRKNIHPYSLWVGNPAKQIGWVSEYGHRLHFDKNGNAACEESKEKYVLKDGKVSKVK